MTNLQMRSAKPFLALAVVIGLGLSAGGCTKDDAVKLIIRQRFGAQAGIAIQIATCESRLQPTAISPDRNNVGLFQINRVHAAWIKSRLGYKYGDLTDPWKNTRVARIMYNASGWAPWHGTCGGRLGI